MFSFFFKEFENGREAGVFCFECVGRGSYWTPETQGPQEWTDILGAISLFLCNTTMATFISLLVIFSWFVCMCINTTASI